MRIDRLLFISLLFAFNSSCSSGDIDQITLVRGMAQDPSVPKKAVDIRPNKVFMAIDKSKGPRGSNLEYSYFSGTFDSNYFQELMRLVQTQFNFVDTTCLWLDATNYELSYRHNGIVKTVLLDSGCLSHMQLSTLERLLSCDSLATKNIKHHNFKGELFYRNLYSTPMPDSGNFIENP